MATSVTFNGSSFTVPAVGDRRWGQNVTNLLISLAGNALAKSGGNFTLTADVNFGANFGVSSKYFKSITSNIAQSGIIRLANNEGIGFRNAANSADIIFKVNASDVLEFNGSPLASTGSVTALEARVTTAEGEIDALQAADVTLQTNINNKLTRSSPLDNFKTLVDAPVSGFIAENAVGLFAHRTITAGSTKLSVSDGAGVAGNPTLDVVEANLTLDNLGGNLATAKVVTPVTTKGDIWVYSTTDDRLAVGANGTVLTADSAQATGLTWSTPLTNPMSAVGDLIIGGTSGAATRLAPNTTTTRKFLTQTGTGAAGQAQVWTDIAGTVPGQAAATVIAAGYIGEVVRATKDRTVASGMATGTTYNIAAGIPLTPGVWLVSAGLCAKGSATSFRADVALTSTSATNPSGSLLGQTYFFDSTIYNLGTMDASKIIPGYVIYVSSTTTWYAIMTPTFSGGDANNYGHIQAVRIA